MTASTHSPPHPTHWTPRLGDGVWPLSHSPPGGESPQVSTLGTRAPAPALAPSGPASVPAGPQSWGALGAPLSSREKLGLDTLPECLTNPCKHQLKLPTGADSSRRRTHHLGDTVCRSPE